MIEDTPIPKIDPKISIGNLLTMATMVLGLFVGWQTMTVSITQNQQAIVDLEKRLATTVAKADATLDALTTNRVELAQALGELQADMRYLKVAVDRLQAPK